MADFELRGADGLTDLAKRIRRHADKKAIQKELYSGLNRATKPIRADMKDSILDAPNLPTSGGLARLVHRTTRFSTKMRTGRYTGIRIVAANKEYEISAINRGRLMHPVFGRGRFVRQAEGTKPKFLDEPFEASAPAVRRELTQLLDRIARRVEG